MRPPTRDTRVLAVPTTPEALPATGATLRSNQRDSIPPAPGRVLSGRYRLLDILGVGGMGRVYRAEQQALGRTVAVKIIHPHLHGDESTAARFITEARAASRLNHPNSVAVIDFGKNCRKDALQPHAGRSSVRHQMFSSP